MAGVDTQVDVMLSISTQLQVEVVMSTLHWEHKRKVWKVLIYEQFQKLDMARGDYFRLLYSTVFRYQTIQ